MPGRRSLLGTGYLFSSSGLQSSDSTCAVTCLNISIGESDVSSESQVPLLYQLLYQAVSLLDDLKLQPTNLRYDLVETTAKTRRTNLVRLIWDSLQSEAYGQPVYIIQIRNSSNSGSLWQTLPVRLKWKFEILA